MTNIKQSLEIVRRHWDTAPVSVEAIARDLGVPIRRLFLPDNISGSIRKVDGGYEIVVNADHASTRQRFTIAHELGHYIYHRDLLGLGVGDDRAYRSDNTDLPNPHIKPEHERQANTFAANLLMPAHLIERLRKQGVTKPRDLAMRLGVSEAALNIRLGSNARMPLFEYQAQDERKQD